MRRACIDAIYRYPVKGLSPERLGFVKLQRFQTLPGDRRYAIENGPAGFDPAAPAYLPKQRFLMLMKNERLARLNTRYDDAADTLTIRVDGREISGNLATPEGRRTIEDFFATFCADELRGPPKILRADGHSFSDVAAKVVSIVNLATVAEIENAIGKPVDPLRFRANLYVADWPAWREFELIGQDLSVSSHVRLRITKRITRCAATDVDPATGMRDRAIPQALMQTFGHMDCGVYSEVINHGSIGHADAIRED